MVAVLRPYLRSGQLVELSAFLPWETSNASVEGPLMEFRGNPYYFLLRAIIDEVSDWVSTSPAWLPLAPVDYFFDDQTRDLQYEVGQQFKTVKSLANRTPLMGEIGFRNDEIHTNCRRQISLRGNDEEKNWI
jgi:hypothetical protein